MGKKGKKRRRQEDGDVSLHTNIALGAAGSQQDSLNDCLAELEGLNQSAQQDTHAARKDLSDGGKKTDEHSSDLWDASGTEHILQPPQGEWKEAFRAYLKDGTYRDGLLPSIQVEITRHVHVEKLSAFLLEKCPELRMPVFERWWLDSKWEEHGQILQLASRKRPPDPVLPAFPSVDSSASHRLIEEILEGQQVDQQEAKQIVEGLCRQTSASEQEILSLSQRSSSNPLKKGDRIEHEDSPDGSSVTLKYSRHGWASPFILRINKSHYQKLQQMFRRMHPEVTAQGKGSKRAVRAFHVIAMVLLLRYSSMSGGQLLKDLRGGGMQGAIHSEVFRVLRSTFSSPLMECFASPLNAYLANFASAFPEIDWHFGSGGTFLEMTFTEGCFEANPPFSPGLMGYMVERIEQSLGTANKKGKVLTFVVIVPTGSKDGNNSPAVKRFASVSFYRMTESQSCRMHIVLPSHQHGFVEGAQHLRPTRYKESAYDTSVIVLQSEAAKSEPLDKCTFEKEIRNAFASRHKSELEGRKQS